MEMYDVEVENGTIIKKVNLKYWWEFKADEENKQEKVNYSSGSF